MPSVERVRWAEFRVAVVSVAAIAILSVLIFLLTGGALFTERVTLYVYIPDGTGLGKDSPVRVDGVTVGKVSGVSLSGSRDPNRVVKVSLLVDRSTLAAIPRESYAQLSFEDPVGNKYVDITSRGTTPRAPESEITYKEQTDFMKSLDLQQFEQQLRQVDAVLTDIETGTSRVGQFVLGTQMYSDLRRRLAQIENDIRAAASTTSQVGEALYTDRLYRQVSEPVLAFDQALARLQSGQGAGLYLRDSAQYDQLRAAAADLGRAMAGLHNDPMLQSDALYREWTSGAVQLIQSVDQLNTNPMFATSEVYDNLNGAAKQFRDTLRDFREHSSKYLRTKIF
jgi:hypothetical protein